MGPPKKLQTPAAFMNKAEEEPVKKPLAPQKKLQPVSFQQEEKEKEQPKPKSSVVNSTEKSDGEKDDFKNSLAAMLARGPQQPRSKPVQRTVAPEPEQAKRLFKVSIFEEDVQDNEEEEKSADFDPFNPRKRQTVGFSGGVNTDSLLLKPQIAKDRKVSARHNVDNFEF